MRVIKREFFGVSRPDTFRIVPIGDIHLGAAACNEDRLRAVVRSVAEDETAYWIGMADYCDFINRSDPRFNPGALASWITMAHLGDLAAAQRDRFLGIIEPIASKCLALVEGNHETAITRHYERAIFHEVVCGVKRLGGFDDDYPLGLGYTGWLLLSFYRRQNKRSAGRQIKFKLHHGFVGGRLAGAKALNMQRFLWANDCDIAIMGHSHNTGMQIEAVETISGSKIIHKKKYGCYSGTFLDSFIDDGPNTYSEVKGYFPMPNTGVEIHLRPGARYEADRIKVLSA